MLYRVQKHYKRTVQIVEILLLLVLFASLYNYFTPIGNPGEDLYFSEEDNRTLFDTLERNGYHVGFADRLLFRSIAPPKSGWYRMPATDKGRIYFYTHLFDTPSPTGRIRIYAGETKEETLARIAHDTGLDLQKLRRYYDEAARFQEGDVIAAYYNVPKHVDEKRVIAYLFDASKKIRNNFFKANYLPPIKGDLYRVLLTVASIVQKETHRKEEMPLIASIIYNRLRKGMKLQMDGTLNYGCYAHTPVTPERIRDDNTSYNTYKHRGLPPAPLSNVSVAALKAAMFPAETDYLFMMLQPDGTHHFSSTYKEHLRYLKKFKAFLKRRKKQKSKTTKTVCFPTSPSPKTKSVQ